MVRLEPCSAVRVSDGHRGDGAKRGWGAKPGVETERFTYTVPEGCDAPVADMCANVATLILYFHTVKDTAGFYHGDPRLDNWFFYNDDDGNATTGLLDWQVCGRGSVLLDLPWM